MVRLQPSFSGPLTGNASTATLAITATNSNNSAVTNDISNPGTTYPVFVNSTPGNQPLRTSSGNLSYVPATGVLTARGFTGLLTGDVIGNASSSVDAQNTVNIRITDDVIAPATMFPTFVPANSGPLAPRVASTKLSFIPLSGELTATTFRGDLTGTASRAISVTGNVSAVNGGTGQSIYSPGDMLYASTSNALFKLPIGNPGEVLRVSSGNVPAWSTAGAGTVTGVSGATNRITVSNPLVAPIVDISPNYVGQNSINTLGTITTGVWNGSVVPVTSGGTGLATLPTSLLVGNGTNPFTTVTGPLGYVLTSTGTTTPPVFQASGGGDMILASTQTVTGNKTYADGTLRLNGSSGGITTLIANSNTSSSVELPPNGIVVNRDRLEILTNKTLTSPILNGTPNLGSAIGTSLNISGNVTAGTFTGPLTGNVTGNASTATSFTNPLAGDVTGNQGSTTVAFVDGIGAATIRLGAQRANAGTAVGTTNTLVARDGSGNFVANQITATALPNGFIGNLSGNAATVTTIPALSGEVSNTGNVVTLSNSAVIGKTLTGYSTGTTAVTAGDNILVAIGKVEGNANLKAPINSPSFTGTVLIPSPFTLGATSVTATGTQLNYLDLASGRSGTGSIVFTNSPTFTGTPTLPTGTIAVTQTAANNTTAVATTAYVDAASNLKANIASPTLTGTPTAPTATLGTNTTQLATTAFVLANIGMLKFTNVPATAPPLIANNAEAELNYPAAGALTAGTVVVSPVGILEAGLGIMSARISAANIVTIRYRNFSGAGITPGVNINITVIQ